MKKTNSGCRKWLADHRKQVCFFLFGYQENVEVIRAVLAQKSGKMKMDRGAPVTLNSKFRPGPRRGSPPCFNATACRTGWHSVNCMPEPHLSATAEFSGLLAFQQHDFFNYGSMDFHGLDIWPSESSSDTRGWDEYVVMKLDSWSPVVTECFVSLLNTI